MKDKITSLINGKYALVFFVVLTTLLYLSCFVDWAVFVLIAFVVIFGLFLDVNNIVAALLFMVSFLVCFSYGDKNIWNYIYIYFVFLLGVRYVLYLFKNEEKLTFKQSIVVALKRINWKILIPIMALFVYWVLPIHSNVLGTVVGNILDFVVMYLVFEMRKEIKFPYLIQIFCLGIVISCLTSLLQPISSRLQEIMVQVPPVNNYTRFAGLTTHPNQLSVFAFIALSLLLFLKYQNKISYINFYALFLAILIFGYCSISRGFIVAFIIALAIFMFMYALKNRKRAIKVFVALACVLFVVGGVFIQETQLNFDRISNLSDNVVYSDQGNNKEEEIVEVDENGKEYVKFSDDWWVAVYNGEIRYDPGRAALWSEYINDWKSSLQTMLLGRGLSHVYIGCMSPHNLYLLLLWRDGIIGLLLQCAIIISFINFRKLKEIKKYYSILIVLAPYLFSCLFELGFMFFNLLAVLCCVYCFNKEQQSNSVLVVTSGVLPVPAVSGGAVESLVQSLLDQNEIYKKEKIEIVSVYNDKAKEVAQTYKNTKYNFYKPNCLICFLDRCIYYFVKNVLKKQKTMTFRNLVQRLCYVHYASTKMRDIDYKSIVIENFSTSFLSLKLYDNDAKYSGKYFYHLHNEVSSTFGCKSIMQECKNILCVSQFIKGSIAKTLDLDINSDNLSVLKNCIDISKFNGEISTEEREALYAKYNIAKDKKVIIFTGRLTQEKGIDVLLECIKDVKSDDFVLLVVGSYFFNTKTSSPFEQKLHQLQKELEGKVVFTGYVNYSDLPKLYAIASFAVLPSMWEEPAGLTILEATASNLPLITTNSGGIVEYCNLENAIVLNRDQDIQKNLSEEITKMLNNIVKVDNQNFIKTFGLKDYYENFIKLIN